VDQLAYGREHGVRVYGETCPQYLFFDDEKLSEADGAKWICSPPLRKKADNQRIWEGLRTGVIQTIATDHCPFFLDGTKPILYEGKEVRIPGKELGNGDFTKIPNGLPGVGDRLPVLWTEMITKRGFSKQDFVRFTSTNPARLFGLYPRKGTLQPGSDADVVIWDPEKYVKYGKAYSQQRTDYNLYEGWKLKGFPKTVISRGEIVIDQGEWFGQPGRGKFLYCKPFLDPGL
jgi:dihydropyrimidinase